MSASQDFRDGAATGAATIARRARQMLSWGIPVDDRVIDKLAEGVVHEYGGRVHTEALLHPDDEFREPTAESIDSVCTCPSGDGSLRWPCPIHPPTGFTDQGRTDD